MPAKRFGDAYFDKAFYQKYYVSPEHRYIRLAEAIPKVRLITAYLRYMRLRPQSIIDFGAGTGIWRDLLKRRFPDARYVGVEASKYAARKHRFIYAKIEHWRAVRKFDLVICHDVLQYLDEDAATSAMNVLNRATRFVCYCDGGLTIADSLALKGAESTDFAVYLRDGSWYRERLQQTFYHLGASLWLRKRAKLRGPYPYELDKVG